MVAKGGVFTGKAVHVVKRNGRFHARSGMPKEFRGTIVKAELRRPKGGDDRSALYLLPGAVALPQHIIAAAEQQFGRGNPNRRVFLWHQIRSLLAIMCNDRRFMPNCALIRVGQVSRVMMCPGKSGQIRAAKLG